MAEFNQQGQTVNYQYNAETINFGAVENAQDFSRELDNLQVEIGKAIDEKALEGEKAIDVEMHIKKAILQSKKTEPDKKILVENLTSAKDLVSGISGLAGAISSAISVAAGLF